MECINDHLSCITLTVGDVIYCFKCTCPSEDKDSGINDGFYEEIERGVRSNPIVSHENLVGQV